MSHSVAITVALCASLLCTACSSTKIDFTDKDAAQAAEAIKGLNKKIRAVTMQETEHGTMANIAWTATASPLITEKTDIRQVLYNLSQAKGIESIGGVVLIIDEVESQEPESKTHALTLGWEMEKLKQVGWVNVADYHLFELASIEEVGPLGNKAIDDYCKNGGSARYGKVFCANAGWSE